MNYNVKNVMGRVVVKVGGFRRDFGLDLWVLVYEVVESKSCHVACHAAPGGAFTI